MLSKKLKPSLFAFFVLSLAAPLFSGSITLINDSAFPLRAVITNAAGDVEGTIDLASQQMFIWLNDNGSFRPLDNLTTTPYTIRWLCKAGRPYDYSTQKKKKNEKTPPKYQNEFGSWDGVPSTATINALGSNSGPKTCVIKKTPPKKVDDPVAKRIHKAPKRHFNERRPTFENSGQGNFSNDGGMTWTNDGGSPFSDDQFKGDTIEEDEE